MDIRRMSKAELDALNEQGRLWRERNTSAQDEPELDPAPTVQMDLWEKEENNEASALRSQPQRRLPVWKRSGRQRAAPALAKHAEKG
jgi:hypothetical protein